MRITESQLRRIIREEALRLQESSSSYFRSPANAPYDVTRVAGEDLEPSGQRRILELFLQEHPNFEKTLLADPGADRQEELMLVMRALRDLVERNRLPYGHTALRQAGQWLVDYYRGTDAYVKRRG